MKKTNNVKSFGEFNKNTIMVRSKIKTTLSGFILEQLKELEEYSTNIEGNRFELLKNGKVVGSTMFSRIMKNDKFNNEPHISLWGFLIREEYRGKGYSKILMEKVLEYLSQKVYIIDLQVMKHNVPAVNLYKSFGFETYADTGHGVLYMSKRLNISDIRNSLKKNDIVKYDGDRYIILDIIDDELRIRPLRNPYGGSYHSSPMSYPNLNVKIDNPKLEFFLNENIYNKIPQPFGGIDVIGMGTFGNKEYPTDAYEAYSEQYDLPNEPILYIHSFFPKEEYKGKGLTKKYLLKTLSDWANHRLDNKELIYRIGKRSLTNFGGSDFFATSSFYDEGEKFFNNLVKNGFLEKINLHKKKEGRALNLFKITNKTKNINI